MSDYQLERLNTRSFEQLVQALSLEIIGNHCQIFGDGPDGGREATFRGVVELSDGAEAWEGYGIIQAKFRQVPSQNPAENANWLIEQLRGDLSRFSSPKKPSALADEKIRRAPDYYIIASNVVLSAMETAGGKDRVTALLQTYKKKLGLKGFALWDGSQIRAFLDRYPSVRTTFAPFVLPGDVLKSVLTWFGRLEADFQSTMLSFLQRELLEDQYARLSQGGYTDAHSVSLSNVFVDLPILPKYSYAEAVAKDGGIARRAHQTVLAAIFDDASRVLKGSLRSDATSTKPFGRFVLVGGPGQGKTTIGQFACQLMRAKLLERSGGSFDPAVSKAVQEISGIASDLPTLPVPRYPLRIDLKQLAEWLSSDEKRLASSVIGFLAELISRRTDRSVSIADLRSWLKIYPWFLVLDGLDEVPSSSNRDRLMRTIDDFIRIEVHEQDADLLVVATTRPQGYSNEFDPKNFNHLTLRGLKTAEAVGYGERLIRARFPGAPSRRDEVSRQLSSAASSKAAQRLMESPLQVTIMLALIEGGGTPPEQRWQLFNEYFRTIYRREKERGTPFSRILAKYEVDILWIHHRAGWVLQQRNAQSGHTAARFSHSEFESLVRFRLKDQGHLDGDELNWLVEQIKLAATDRLVLLVGNTSDEIGFEVRSLQEFMAAEHCFDGSSECLVDTLRSIAPSAYWRNVFLFVAGRIYLSKQNLGDHVWSICADLNEPSNDPMLARIRAGSALALALLIDDVCPSQPKNVRRLARLASGLLDINLNNGSSFAGQFRGFAEAPLREELECRLNSANFNQEAWQLCLHLALGGVVWAKDLINEHYPSSAEGGRVLVDFPIDGSLEDESYYWRLLAHRLRFVDPTSLRDIHFDGLRGNIPDDVLDALIDVNGFPSNRVKLVLSNGELSENDLGRKEADLISGLRRSRVVGTLSSDAHLNWRAIEIAAEFCQSPSHTSLIKAIRRLEKVSPSLLDRLPWQLSCSAQVLMSGLTIEDLEKRIEANLIGGPDEWSRWAELELVRIGSLGHVSGIFSAEDGKFGALFAGRAWTYSHSGTAAALEFAAEIVNQIGQLDPVSPTTTAVLELACFGLLHNAQTIDASDFSIFPQLIDALIQAGVSIPIELTVAVLLAKVPESEKIRCIAKAADGLNSQAWVSGWNDVCDEMEETLPSIIKASFGHQSEFGFLRVLSALPPLQAFARISRDTLNRLAVTDEKGREARDLLVVKSASWSRDECQLAVQVLQADPSGRLVTELVEHIESRRVYRAELELVFLQLAASDVLEVGQDRLDQYLLVLADLSDRRPTPLELPDPEGVPKSKLT